MGREKGKWIWSFQFLQVVLYHRRFCMRLLHNGKSSCLQDTFQQQPGRKAHCVAFTFSCQIPCYYFRKAQLQAQNFHSFFSKNAALIRFYKLPRKGTPKLMAVCISVFTKPLCSCQHVDSMAAGYTVSFLERWRNIANSFFFVKHFIYYWAFMQVNISLLCQHYCNNNHFCISLAS